MSWHGIDQVIVYRNVGGSPQGYELLPPLSPEAKIVKAGKFPGEFGYPDLYISHLPGKIEMIDPRTGEKEPRPFRILVIAYTEKPMTDEWQNQIIQGGWDYFMKEIGLGR